MVERAGVDIKLLSTGSLRARQRLTHQRLAEPQTDGTRNKAEKRELRRFLIAKIKFKQSNGTLRTEEFKRMNFRCVKNLPEFLLRHPEAAEP